MEEDQEQSIKQNLRYLVMPDFVYEDERLTDISRRVYCFIHTFKGDYFIFSNEHMAKMFHCSDWSISQAIKQLQKLEYIDTNYKIKANGGKIRFIKDLKFEMVNRWIKPRSDIGSTQSPTVAKPNDNDNKINNISISKDIDDAKRPLSANKIKKEPSETQQLYRRIINHLQETLSMTVTSWGKQCSAIKSMLDAGYTELQITKTISYMANKDEFYSDKGFDMTTVAKQIPLYKAQMRKAVIT